MNKLATKKDVDRISTREREPFKLYFNKTDMTKVSVLAGTLSFYQAHWLWGACGSWPRQKEVVSSSRGDYGNVDLSSSLDIESIVERP